MAINRLPHLTVALFCLICLGAFVSCNESCDICPPPVESPFENEGRMVINLYPTKVAAGQPFRLETGCTPRFTGKGRVWLMCNRYSDGTGVAKELYIDAPVRDTLRPDLPADTISGTEPIPVEFTAHKPFLQIWSVRFSHAGEYTIRARAVMDSIYLPDSLRMMPASDTTVLKYYGINRSIYWDVTAAGGLIVAP